jgi:hypothetical protein
VHLQQAKPAKGDVQVKLLSADKVLEEVTLPIEDQETLNLTVPFQKPLAAGFYKVGATFRRQGRFREFYENGFWVAERSSLDDGEALGVKGDFLTRGGKPFSPLAPTTSPRRKMAGIFLVRATHRCGKATLLRWPRTVSRLSAPASG